MPLQLLVSYLQAAGQQAAEVAWSQAATVAIDTVTSVLCCRSDKYTQHGRSSSVGTVCHIECDRTQAACHDTSTTPASQK
jgi:hypothetical protein